MQDTNFQKILNNTATDQEKERFYKLLENNSLMRADFLRYKNLYVVSNLNKKNTTCPKNKSFKQFWDQTQKNKSIQLIHRWTKYAAIFVLALLLGGSTHYFLMDENVNQFQSQVITYRSTPGSTSAVKLDDGSTIWLSTASELTVEKNTLGEIHAKLDGEAFFDMIPNSDRKFIVDFGKFQVRDIGTKFNIRAYSNETSVMTSLLEGKVELIKQSKKLLEIAKPGESFSYDKLNNKITISQQDTSIISAWKDGKFVFIDKSLAEICKELENWYNIEIRIEDKTLAGTRYTSMVKRSTTVKMVLEILAITDQIQYEITNMKEGKDIVLIKR